MVVEFDFERIGRFGLAKEGERLDKECRESNFQKNSSFCESRRSIIIHHLRGQRDGADRPTFRKNESYARRHRPVGPPYCLRRSHSRPRLLILASPPVSRAPQE